MTSQALNRPVDVLAVLDGDVEGMESALKSARGTVRIDLIAGIEQMRDTRAAVAELIEACRAYVGPMDDPRIGWCGQSPSHPGMFKCESCGQEHWDCSLIEHKPGCSVPRLLAALAAIGSQP